MEFTIPRSTRTLSFGATSAVHRVPTADGTGYLSVDTVTPDMAGRPSTPRVILSQWEDARRRNRGNQWSAAFFVAGHRIIGESHDTVLALADLINGRVDSITVEVS